MATLLGGLSALPARPLSPAASAGSASDLSALPARPPSSATSAAGVLRTIVPTCGDAVLRQLASERVFTAADLAALDKADLQELGFSMVDRGRVLRWARQVFDGSLPESGSPVCASSGTLGLTSCQRNSSELSLPFMGSEASTRLADDEDLGPQRPERKLDDIESQADFWCGLVSAAAPVPRRPRWTNCIHDVRETVLEERFDVTPERVLEVFSDMRRATGDVDTRLPGGPVAGGAVGAAQLADGLRRCGFVGIDEATLSRVIEAVQPEQSGRIRLAEFESIVSRLKLAQMFVGVGPADSAGDEGGPTLRGQMSSPVCVPLTVVDYNSRFCHARDVDQWGFREFCFGHRGRPASPHETPYIRWAHMTDFDLTTLFCLAVKYSLHPLGVEDTIEQCATKFDRVGCNYFAAVEQLCLVDDPCCRTESGSLPVRVAGYHVSAFCSGPPLFDTVITVAQPDRSFASDWPGEPHADTAGGQRWADKLRQRLTSAHRSRLRERKADFLFYQVIDLSADDLQAVIRAFAARLVFLEAGAKRRPSQRQQGPEASERTRREHCSEPAVCRQQLTVVMRRIRGLQRALRHFRADADLSAELAGYLQDVAEHLDEAHEDAVSLVEKCARIMEEHHRVVERHDEKLRQRTADRLNNTLFALTAGTFIFAPMQFFAGVYGMNFVTKDGSPTIPELVSENGYLYFWLGVLGYLSVVLPLSAWWYLRIQRRSAEDAEEFEERCNPPRGDEHV